MAFGRIRAALVDYCENSKVHGLRYVVAKNHHWSERLLWSLLCAASWSAALVALVGTVRLYVDSPPCAISVDTADRDWITPYPAIGICSASSQSAKDHAASIIEKFAHDRNSSVDARGLSEQLFLSSRMGYVKQLERLDVPAEHYLAINDKVKPNCSESLTSCKWRGVEFDCCDEFAHLHTSVGHCLLLNSVHARAARSTLDFRIDLRSSSIGSVGLEIGITDHYAKSNPEFRVYLLNGVEIPTLRTAEDRVLRNVRGTIGIDFNVIDLVNLPGVEGVAPLERQCRFAHENVYSEWRSRATPMHRRQPVYELYSYDGCTVDTEFEEMLSACGCASYVYPRPKSALLEMTCNMTGMRCCAQLRRRTSNKFEEATIGSCPADCQATTYKWHAYPIAIDDKSSSSINSFFVGLRVRLLSWPRMRYQRYVARSSFDIFVLSGASIGLFTGASILSFVELVYRIVTSCWITSYRR